jgi:hypothetical protein
MTRRNLPIALYMLLVFASGAVVGALGYRTYNPPIARSGSLNPPPPPTEWRRQYLDESKARLNLTDDQIEKMTVILDQTDARFREARQRDSEAIRQIREEHMARIREMLTPEQLPKYEKLRAEREQRRQQELNKNKR